MFFFLTMATSEHSIFTDILNALTKEMVPDPISCVDAALLDRTLFPLKQHLVPYLVLDGEFQKATERKHEDEGLKALDLKKIFSEWVSGRHTLKWLFYTPLPWVPAEIVTYCCCCLVAKSYLTLCSPMNCSTPAFPVLHYFPEFAQTQIHWVGDVIQPSHPLSSLSLPALSLSQDQGLFQWVGSPNQVAKVLELQP